MKTGTQRTLKGFSPVGPLVLAGLFVLAGCARQSEPAAITDPATRQIVAEANQALERQEYDRALALADSAAKLAPDAVEPDFLRGLVYSRILRWKEAEAAYRRVIDRDPDYPGVWNNLGNNAVWQSAYRDALTYYQKEVEIEAAPIPWASIGRVYRELGVVDSAAMAFEKAIALDSTYVPAYISFARLMEDEGEYERALAMTRRADRISPGTAEVDYMLGSLLIRVGQDNDAVPHLQAVIDAWPWHTESHYKLGQALQRLGRTEESAQLLARAEKLWKRQADITSYQKAVTTDPDNPYSHAALATAFRIAGRYDEAVRTYKVALSLDPKNHEFQNNLAALYFLQKDTLAAIRTYEHILKEDPQMVEVWLNLGVLFALGGRKEGAREAWTQALHYRPNDPTAMAYLAKINSGR